MNKITETDSAKIEILLKTELYTLQEIVLYFNSQYTINQIKYHIEKCYPELSENLRRESSRGNIKLLAILQDIYPHVNIESEYPIGDRLRLDAYLPEPYNLGFEYDGVQHEAYTPGLHESEDDFLKSLNNDKRKEEICIGRGINLIRIHHSEDLNKELILQRINQIGYGSGKVQPEFYTSKEKLDLKRLEINKARSIIQKQQYQKYKGSEQYAKKKEDQRNFAKQRYQQFKQRGSSPGKNSFTRRAN